MWRVAWNTVEGFCCVRPTGAHDIAQVGLELEILLTWHPENWGLRYVPPLSIVEDLKTTL